MRLYLFSTLIIQILATELYRTHIEHGCCIESTSVKVICVLTGVVLKHIQSTAKETGD